jgi:hypothetical protein
MDLAMSATPLEGSAVDDFAVRLCDTLGFTSRQVSLRTRKDIELVICGMFMHAKTDVCLLTNRSEIILLVQEDKQHRNREEIQRLNSLLRQLLHFRATTKNASSLD